MEKCFLPPTPKHRRGAWLVQSGCGLWNSRRLETKRKSMSVYFNHRGSDDALDGMEGEGGSSRERVFSYFYKSMVGT